MRKGLCRSPTRCSHAMHSVRYRLSLTYLRNVGCKSSNRHLSAQRSLVAFSQNSLRPHYTDVAINEKAVDVGVNRVGWRFCNIWRISLRPPSTYDGEITLSFIPAPDYVAVVAKRGHSCCRFSSANAFGKTSAERGRPRHGQRDHPRDRQRK